MVVIIMYNEAFYLDDMLSSIVDVWEIYPFPDFNSQTSVWALQKDYTMLYQRTGTASVMINVCYSPVYLEDAALLTSFLSIDHPRRCDCMLEGLCGMG